MADQISGRQHLRPLTAKSLWAALMELEHAYHHIYALWKTASAVSFSIRIEENYYTLPEFLERADTIDPATPLVVIFHKVHFEDAESLTTENIERTYESYLHHHCEMGLRRNEPLCLTPELIKRCKLTDADAAIVREHLEVLNKMIRRRLQQEYNELKELDCIKK